MNSHGEGEGPTWREVYFVVGLAAALHSGMLLVALLVFGLIPANTLLAELANLVLAYLLILWLRVILRNERLAIVVTAAAAAAVPLTLWVFVGIGDFSEGSWFWGFVIPYPLAALLSAIVALRTRLKE